MVKNFIVRNLEIFFYYNDNRNYIKELSKGDNTNELIQNHKENLKKIKYIKILLAIPFLVLVFSLNIIKQKLIILSIFITFQIFYYMLIKYIYKVIVQINYNFINLCKDIVYFERTIKSIKKQMLYYPFLKDVYLHHIEIINKELRQVIKKLDNNILLQSNIKNNNEYEEYLKLKGTIFQLLFNSYEYQFTNKKSYIHIFLYSTLHCILKEMKNIYIKSKKAIELSNINYNEGLSEYENIIKNSIMNDTSKKMQEDNINLIYELLLKNTSLNHDYIKIIDLLTNSNKNEEITTKINEIIEKKLQSINLLKNLKEKINPEKENENKIEKNNENIKTTEQKDEHVKTYSGNSLNNTEETPKKKEEKNLIKINTKEMTYEEIKQEEKKAKLIQLDFINEFKNYCNKINGYSVNINDNKEDNINKNINDIDLNKKNIFQFEFSKSINNLIKNTDLNINNSVKKNNIK